MEQFSVYMMPAVLCIILVFGIIKRVPLFDTFLAGAKEGLRASVAILPALVGLMMAVAMLSASGALELFTVWVSPVADWFGLPAETLPLVLLRPISGSGSTAILTQIYDTYGADGFVGRVASVMMGSTETTFYAIAVYFGAVGVKKTRHAIPAALMADTTGYILSVLAVRLFFR